MAREQKIPGPDHPITVADDGVRVTVRIGDLVVADTARALTLREANYPPAYYVPMADVERSVLRESDTSTYCPYKGDASYYSVCAPDVDVADAMWFYPEPYDAVAAIADHVAFYPDRVDLTVGRPG